MNTDLQGFSPACRRLCDHADWSRPELAGCRKLYDQGRFEDAALALVAHLRSRQEPVFDYQPAYVEALRKAASVERRRTAAQRLAELAFPTSTVQDLTVAIKTPSDLELHLGATPEFCARMAEAVLALQEKWKDWNWWHTYHVINLIKALWPLKECGNREMVPLLGWLLDGTRTYWEGSRGWDELMLGTGGHNYFVTTYGGLIMAGLLFAEFKVTAPFKDMYSGFLDFEIKRLMRPDGFSRERAGYHYGTGNELIHFARLAALNGIVLSPKTKARLRAVAAVRWKIVTPDGGIPCNGDTAKRHSGSACAELRIDAARFDLPEAKYVAQTLAPDWRPPFPEFLPDGGENLFPKYKRLPASMPPAFDTSLPHSGYYIMRQDWTPKADYCFIDAGTRGAIGTSHDHVAVFNIELFSRGRLALMDNSSGPYGGTPARRWRIGSSAHNVAVVDGEDHVPITSEWRRGLPVVPIIENWLAKERFVYFSGAHEGYTRLPSPVVHRRKLFYLRGEYWILIDRFNAEKDATHTYQVYFQLAAPAKVLTGDRVVTQGKGGNILIVPVAGASGALTLESNLYPLEGYDNPDRLSCAQETKGNALFVALLAPFEDDKIPDVQIALADVESDGRLLSPWEGTGLALHLNGREDFYFDQHMSWNLPWVSGAHSGNGRLFHSRT